MSTIFGHSWEAIQRAQQGGKLTRQTVDTSAPGDYGADPIGNGLFRMVPSGDVVDYEERKRRLAKIKATA